MSHKREATTEQQESGGVQWTVFRPPQEEDQVDAEDESPNTMSGHPKRIAKEDINALQLYRYTGEIVVISKLAEVTHELLAQLRVPVLGFDTESQPAFRKGEYYPPALIQLHNGRDAFIFKLLADKRLLSSLAPILNDQNILKVGAGVSADIEELRSLAPGVLKPSGMCDINTIARSQGFQQSSLKNLAAILFNWRVSKKEQMSNWGMYTRGRPLTDGQLRYAACDAYLSLMIYRKLVGEEIDMSSVQMRQSM